MYRNVVTEISPDRNVPWRQRLRPKWLRPKRLRPQRPDRIGQTENSCSGFYVFLSVPGLKICEKLEPVSSEISDLRNFWLHTMYTCTE